VFGYLRDAPGLLAVTRMLARLLERVAQPALAMLHWERAAGLAVDPYVPLARAAAQLERRQYYAAVSWVDRQIGSVLDALEESGLAADTAVVLHADHGFSLGEQGEWEKFTTWEAGTRVPLIVRAPWLANSSGLRVDTPAELVDVMPTLAALQGSGSVRAQRWRSCPTPRASRSRSWPPGSSKMSGLATGGSAAKT
jgi:arylsulfatase A-like enzyme